MFFHINPLTRKLANSKTRKLANSQTRKLANSQTRKLANSQTKKGFTLVELMIALGIGFGVIAATASAYFFVTKNGKGLESQIEFCNMYRTLNSRFTEVVELSRSLIADEDGNGITLTMQKEESDDTITTWEEWIGFISNDDISQSKLVYRPKGKDYANKEVVLCSYVSKAPKNAEGERPPVFYAKGPAVIMTVFIGEKENMVNDPTPGRQGLLVSIASASRNLRRKL